MPEGKIKSKIILGYSTSFHDPAIAIVNETDIFAESFERHCQLKRALCMPFFLYSAQSIKQALQSFLPKTDERVDVVIRTTWNDTFWVHFKNTIRLFFEGIKRSFISRRDNERSKSPIIPLMVFVQGWYLYGSMVIRNFAKNLFQDKINSIVVKKTDHHLAHASNAVFTSNFSECVVMILDGHGEDESCTFFHFKDNSFKLLSKNDASLGFLFATITTCCGFNPLRGDEWKVMGLAPYGKYQSDIYNFFMDNTKIDGIRIEFKNDLKKLEYSCLFNFFREGSITEIMNSKLNSHFKELAEIVGGFRDPQDGNYLKSADLAFNFQKYFSDVVITLVCEVAKLGLSKNLGFVGGCALNSSTNGKILENSPFEALHVPFAPADDGNALGVALFEKYLINKYKRDLKILSPYLGSEINISNLERILSYGGLRFKKIDNEDDLVEMVAGLISQGEIVGWMQGKAEFGPRALGNRSILADPRDPQMKDKVNSLVKFREAYRPLAPSILHENGQEYFENYQESPYMERTLRFKPEVWKKVPAVVHVDGTGRLQTVKEEWNSLYYKLIKRFYKQTGIPILLNTSLNVRGKPIVHSEEDALNLFFTTGLKNLVIGPYLIQKLIAS